MLTPQGGVCANTDSGALQGLTCSMYTVSELRRLSTMQRTMAAPTLPSPHAMIIKTKAVGLGNSDPAGPPLRAALRQPPEANLQPTVSGIDAARSRENTARWTCFGLPDVVEDPKDGTTTDTMVCALPVFAEAF